MDGNAFRPLTATIALGALGLLAFGCGGGDDSTTTTTTTQATSSTTTQTETETLDPDATDFLGAVLAATTAGEPGVVVLEVAPDSLSRLKRGDVIIACNGKPVSTPDELVDCGADVEINEQFTIRVVRGSDRLTLAQVATPSAYLGAGVQDATGSPKGAVVVDVVRGSPAAAADLRKDDVITALDGAPVRDGDSLLEAVGTHVPGDQVTVTVTRGSKELELTATLVSRPDPREGG